MWRLLSGLWMGWGLGANDAANIFGPGVAARIVTFRTAVTLIAIFAILGAVMEGPKCMETLGKLAAVKNQNEAFVILFSAAFTVMLMSLLGIPISTSQAVVGSILGSLFYKRFHGFDGAEKLVEQLYGLVRIFICWVGTPLGAMIIAFILFYILERVIEKYIRNIVMLDRFIKWGIILSGCYGAYCLGANNVANTTGIYVGHGGMKGLLSPGEAALYGGIAIAVGAITFSRNVMYTVGEKITVIGPLGALIAGVSHSLTVHFYTQIGVPVSSSQAIVGAVVGIGLIKGMKAISARTLIYIVTGWFFTPVISGISSYAIIACFMSWGISVI